MDAALEIIDASLEALLNEPFASPLNDSFASPGALPIDLLLADVWQTEREFSRVPFRGRAPALIYPAPDSTSLPYESEVLTTDISRKGLSLLHRRELACGQKLVLRLSLTNCAVEVCWCCRVWPNLYVAGCRFLGEERAPACDPEPQSGDRE